MLLEFDPDSRLQFISDMVRGAILRHHLVIKSRGLDPQGAFTEFSRTLPGGIRVPQGAFAGFS